MSEIEFLAKYFITSDGRAISRTGWSKEERELSPFKDRDGYLAVHVVENGKQKSRFLHRLVAAHFLASQRNPGDQVRHLNGDKTDNRVENLAWGTAQDNADDRDRHGRTARGERNGRAKLTDDHVREIRVLLAKRITQPRIAAQYGVYLSSIEKIASGKRWAHVEGRVE